MLPTEGVHVQVHGPKPPKDTTERAVSGILNQKVVRNKRRSQVCFVDKGKNPRNLTTHHKWPKTYRQCSKKSEDQQQHRDECRKTASADLKDKRI